MAVSDNMEIKRISGHILERKMRWIFSVYSNWNLAQSKHSLWCYVIIHNIFKVNLNQ